MTKFTGSKSLEILNLELVSNIKSAITIHVQLFIEETNSKCSTRAKIPLYLEEFLEENRLLETPRGWVTCCSISEVYYSSLSVFDLPDLSLMLELCSRVFVKVALKTCSFLVSLLSILVGVCWAGMQPLLNVISSFV